MAEGSATTEKREALPEKIKPEILDSLGLSPEDIDSYRQKLHELAILPEIKKSHNKGYQSYNKGRENPGRIDEITVLDPGTPTQFAIRRMGTNISEWPQTININWQARKADLLNWLTKEGKSTEDLEQRDARVKSFIEGWGRAALEKDDWLTVINSYDIVTEGGVMKNQEVMTKLREMAQKDKDVGVQIAATLEMRVK